MVVIIPAYEPDERLIKLAQEIKLKTDYDIVIINDGSALNKQLLFSKLEEYAEVMEHKHNLGKGKSIKTALKYIEDNYPDDLGIVVADADGQHRYDDIIKVSRALETNENSLILGSRQFTGNVPAKSKFGNTVTRYIFKCASGVKLNDTQTGLRAFNSKIIPFLLKVPGDRYEYEMNVLLECAKQKINIIEVPIETIYIENNESSHFRVIRDSARIYKDIIKFSFSSLLSFVLDFFIYSLMIFLTSGMVQSTSIIISNVFARAISASFNFYINKNYVFKDKGKSAKAAVKYFELAAFILIVNTFLLNIVVNLIGNEFVSKIIVESSLFTISWIVQKYFIFKSSHGEVKNAKISTK
ncbi:MAG: GtrA family protein [Sedimentibacter sp.]